MSNDVHVIKVTLARLMPSYVPVAMYAILFGLGLSFELYVGNPTAIIYALVGIGFALTYLVSVFYNLWANAHNSLTRQQVTLEAALSSIEDGTFQDVDGLKKGSKDNDEESPD